MLLTALPPAPPDTEHGDAGSQVMLVGHGEGSKPWSVRLFFFMWPLFGCGSCQILLIRKGRPKRGSGHGFCATIGRISPILRHTAKYSGRRSSGPIYVRQILPPEARHSLQNSARFQGRDASLPVFPEPADRAAHPARAHPVGQATRNPSIRPAGARHAAPARTAEAKPAPVAACGRPCTRSGFADPDLTAEDARRQRLQAPGSGSIRRSARSSAPAGTRSRRHPAGRARPPGSPPSAGASRRSVPSG